MTLKERVEELRKTMQRRVESSVTINSYNHEAADIRDLCDAVLEELAHND